MPAPGHARRRLGGTYHWLDLTPLGRQRYVTEFPYHDSYRAGT